MFRNFVIPFLVVAAVLVAVFVGAPMALALDVSDVAMVSTDDRLADTFTSILNAVYSLIYLPFAAPLVVLLTGVTKRFITLNAHSIAFAWTVALWVLYMVAVQIGYGAQFESVVAGLITIGVGVFGVAGTDALAGRIYDEVRDNNTPVLGYQRPGAVQG